MIPNDEQQSHQFRLALPSVIMTFDLLLINQRAGPIMKVARDETALSVAAVNTRTRI